MRRVSSIVFALALMVCLGLVTESPVLAAGTIRVPGDYPTIQQAVDAAGSGDTIIVAAGKYAAFQVIGKNNIHIIGAEGAIVATANLYTALPIVGDTWVLAAVYNSTNISIEGINFDGTGASGKPLVVGIAYVDSTGTISRLTVENVVATARGWGVAIIGYTGTSVVNLTGAAVKNSMIGIFVAGADAILEAHFNNIVGNTLCGACSYENGTLDATRNWWGDVSGPHHATANPDGSGDTVSDNVDFKPWLGAADIVIQTVTNKTVDARAETQTEVLVTGTATVIIAKYASNPHPPTSTLTLESYATDALADFVPLDIWRDVCVINTKPGTETEIRLYYSDSEVAAANVTEESLRLFWHNGNDWVACSDSGVNTASVTVNGTLYSGYMWAKVTSTTTPSLADLGGTPWGGYGHPTEVPDCCSARVAAASGINVVQKLNILREFRDAVLLPDSSGAKFVSLYYRTSPPIAKLMSQHELLRTAARVCLLEPIVAILGWSHDLWSAEGFMSLAAIAVTR